jgi:hypothetical protein
MVSLDRGICGVAEEKRLPNTQLPMTAGTAGYTRPRRGPRQFAALP